LSDGVTVGSTVGGGCTGTLNDGGGCTGSEKLGGGTSAYGVGTDTPAPLEPLDVGADVALEIGDGERFEEEVGCGEGEFAKAGSVADDGGAPKAGSVVGDGVAPNAGSEAGAEEAPVLADWNDGVLLELLPLAGVPDCENCDPCDWQV
jgi:hypothetical protein